ncbi:hypothetical protein GCM10028784_26910 [Myceligenerans cantabricum]
MTAKPDLSGAKPTDVWGMFFPPGWVRFPTGPDQVRELDEAIEEVVRRSLPDDLPRDSVEPHRHLMRDALRGTFTEATEAGAGAVYLPTEPLNGIMTPCSVTEAEIVSDAGSNPVEVAASILTEDYDESELVEVDGRPGARVATTSHDVRHDGDFPEVSTKQVVYVISRDDAEGDWLVMSFSTVWNSEEGERVSEALVIFFDALMSTFRWAGPGARPLTPLDGAAGSSADR